MTDPVVLVEIRQRVRVKDPAALLAYAREQAVSWGYDATSFDGDDLHTLSVAAREAIVLNVLPREVLDAVIELEGWEAAARPDD